MARVKLHGYSISRNVSIFLILFCSASTEDYNKTVSDEQPAGVISDIFLDSGLDLKVSPSTTNSWTVTLLSSDQDYSTILEVTDEQTLVLKQTLDRDVYCPRLVICHLSLTLQVLNDRSFPEETIKVGLNVLDINDSPPTFSRASYNLTVSEFAAAGTMFELTRAMASDVDSPAYGIDRYELTPDYPEFRLDTTPTQANELQPRLILSQELNREEEDSYSLTLTCFDKGSPPLSGQTQIQIIVGDINDNYPKFVRTDYEFPVPEDADVNTFVGQVSATDADVGLNSEIVYSISSENGLEGSSRFRIDPATGEIFVAGALDYETREQHSLGVSASNPDVVGLSVETNVLVTVSDVNDNPPLIRFSSLVGDVVVVQENIGAGVFVVYVTVRDVDLGAGGDFQCGINSLQFALQPGELAGDTRGYTITTAAPLDREQRGQYDVIMTCIDDGSPQLNSAESVRIIVGDENDNPPEFDPDSITVDMSESLQVGSTVMTVKATDADVGVNAEMLYSVSPPSQYFTVHPVTGDVTLIQAVDYEEIRTLAFTVHAKNNNTLPGAGETTTPGAGETATLSVTVAVIDSDDSPPTFLNASYVLYVLEHERAGTYVDAVQAFDLDTPAYSDISYNFVASTDSPAPPPFRIDSKAGTIFTTAELDRELTSMYHFRVQASGPPPALLSSTCDVTVVVEDINDHSPVFMFPNSANNTVTMTNVFNNNTFVTRVNCTDADEDENAEIFYYIYEQSSENLFRINPYTGDVYSNRRYSTDEGIATLRLRASNSGGGVFTETSLVIRMQPPPPQTLPQTSRTNQTTVIIIGVIAGIVATVLIVAIIFFLLRYKRRRSAPKLATTGKPASTKPEKKAPPPYCAPPRVWSITSGVNNVGYTAGDDGQGTDAEHQELDLKPKDLLAISGEDLPDLTAVASRDGSDSGHGSHDDSVFYSARPPPPLPPRLRQLSVPPPYLPPRGNRAMRASSVATDLVRPTPYPSLYTNHRNLLTEGLRGSGRNPLGEGLRGSGHAPSRTHSDSFVPPSYASGRTMIAPELNHIPDERNSFSDRQGSLEESLETGRLSVMYLVGQPPHRVHYCSQV